MAQCRGCGRFLTIAETGAPCPNCECMDRNVTSFEQAHAVEGAVAEAAKVLAWKHYELEEGLTHIFRITDKTVATVTRGAPIKLLEVNTNTSESGIMPLQFGPAPASGVPYASVIVEVSPSEFQKLQSNELKLPEGWSIGEEFPRPMDVGGR